MRPPRTSSTTRTTRRPLRARGVREHLLPHHEPDGRRAREAPGRDGRRRDGPGFASGQSAINAALLTLCHSGQNFISATSLYGGTWTLFTQTFKNLGVEVRFFDPNQPEQIHELVDENTRCVYIESIGNPKNDVPDFKAITDSRAQRPHGACPCSATTP